MYMMYLIDKMLIGQKIKKPEEQIYFILPDGIKKIESPKNDLVVIRSV